MPAFKRYQSKPITRLAYEIKQDDGITEVQCDSTCIVRSKETGEQIEFVAHQQVKPGDFIVYLKDDDIYHCARDVFFERNVVNESNN